MEEHSDTPILEVRHLYKQFGSKAAKVCACKDVSLTVSRGTTTALVGTSGSGKSTLARCVARLYRIDGGQILYEGAPIETLSQRAFLPYRRKMQMIFQDPYASLNPRMTIEEIICEPLLIHKLAKGQERDRVADLLEQVGLRPDHMTRYPHEFSGGQRQRIGIARALAVEPEFLILDEPLSALDLSIQAQVANLLEELQQELGLSFLFIAHDLAMVRHLADQVYVMHQGEIVESGHVDALFDAPQHAYTQQLLAAATRL